MTLSDYLDEIGSRGRGSALAVGIGAPPESISQWKTGVRRVPAERCPEIERFTSGAVRCEDLRPDIDWAVLRRRVKAA